MTNGTPIVKPSHSHPGTAPKPPTADRSLADAFGRASTADLLLIYRESVPGSNLRAEAYRELKARGIMFRVG